MRSRSAWPGALACALLLGSARVAVGDEARALSHDDALRLAAERNAQLLVAKLERARQRANAGVARRDYLPELTVVAAGKETGAADKQSAVETIATLSYKSPYGQSVSVSGAFTQGIAPARAPGRALTIDVSQAVLRGAS